MYIRKFRCVHALAHVCKFVGSLHDTQHPHIPDTVHHQQSPRKTRDPYGPHATPDSRGSLQTQDPYGPLDAIPPPAPLSPQPPDSPIWRRAEPSAPQTPTRKTTEPTSGQRSSITSGQRSPVTIGHSEWTSDTSDNSVQNASQVRNLNVPRVSGNQAETGQRSSRYPGNPPTGRHHSSGGQWIAETGQNEWSADDWSSNKQSTGRNSSSPGGHQRLASTPETPSSSSKGRSTTDDDQEVFLSPGHIYGRCGAPPPPPRRLSHTFVRETARVFDTGPLAPSSRQHIIAARRVSMPGELRRPHSSSPARTVRLSSFIGSSDDGAGGELQGQPPLGSAKLNLFRSPTRLSRYTQDLATGIYSTFNRPDLQDQWLNVTDVQTMRDALALQREIAAKENTVAAAAAGNRPSPGTVGIRCAPMRRRSASTSSSSSDEDSSSASGDSQTTILRAPKQHHGQENGK